MNRGGVHWSPADVHLSGTICFPSIESYYSAVAMRGEALQSGPAVATNKKNKGER
jgi:hypothetical protein